MGGLGQLGNQEEPQHHCRKGLFSRGNNSTAMKSRVNREVQARCCERLVVKLHRPTRLVTVLRQLPHFAQLSFVLANPSEWPTDHPYPLGALAATPSGQGKTTRSVPAGAHPDN